MHLYFTDRDSPITKDVSNWSMDDEIYYDMDMLPEARVLAAAYTPKPAGARNADFAETRRRAHRRRQAREHLRRAAADVDLRAHRRRRPRAVSRVRVDSRASLRELQPAELPRDPAARDRLGRQARERRRAPRARTSSATACATSRADRPRPAKAAAKIEVHPGVRPDARRRRAADPEGDEHRLGRDAAGCGSRRRPSIPTAAACRTPSRGRTAARCAAAAGRAIRKTRFRSSPTRNGDGVMDRKHVFADKLELVTGFVLYRTGVIAATSPDIWYLEDTNGDEVADKRTKLYTGLGTADTHAVINNLRWGLDGWIYATHGYSVGDGDVAGRHEELRPRRQRRRPLQAGRQRVRAVQQPRRQHLGPRHHVGRPGVLDAADERHGVLPHRAAGERAGQGPDPGDDVVEGDDHRPEHLSR